MSQPVFPDIALPAYPFANPIENPAIQSSMENGVVISRPRFTRTRESFTLKWDVLSTADYYTLKAFYKETVLGGSLIFTWNYPDIEGDPYRGTAFDVRFTSEAPNFQLIAFNQWQGQVTIQEA